MNDLLLMAKASTKVSRSGKSGSFVRGRAVLGTTPDGVNILKPPRATHFTTKELREAVAAVVAAK